jgi:LPXTG-motif cell wall-anchored protein
MAWPTSGSLAWMLRCWSALTTVPCLGAAQVAAVVAGLLLVAGAAVILRRRAGSTAVH